MSDTSHAGDEQPDFVYKFQNNLEEAQHLAGLWQPLPSKESTILFWSWAALCFLAGVFDSSVRSLFAPLGAFAVFIAVGLISALIALLAYITNEYLRRARVRAARAPSAATTLEVWPEHLEIRANGQEKIFMLEAIRATSLDDQGLLIDLPGREHLLIPVRAFKSHADMRSFHSYLEVIMNTDEDQD